VPILGSHFARSHDWCHHYFLWKMNSKWVGKWSTEPSNIYGCNMRGQPSGENCYLKVFL
jgi:hypothetical protein